MSVCSIMAENIYIHSGSTGGLFRLDALPPPTCKEVIDSLGGGVLLEGDKLVLISRTLEAGKHYTYQEAPAGIAWLTCSAMFPESALHSWDPPVFAQLPLLCQVPACRRCCRSLKPQMMPAGTRMMPAGTRLMQSEEEQIIWSSPVRT